MGDGIYTPLTREDVIKLIEENGGETKGLDLSRKEFIEEIDLRGINKGHLLGIILNEAVLERAHLEGLSLIYAQLKGAFLDEEHLDGANLAHANLENANLPSAHLRDTRLFAAHLEGAELYGADLQNASLIDTFLYKTGLSSAKLQGCNFHGAKFDSSTQMESTDWGNFLLANEINGNLNWAQDTYRQLKQWYTNAGLYNIAGKFYYREMEAGRKNLKWRRSPLSKLWKTFYWILCGYGENPGQVMIWSSTLILICALIYFAVGTLEPNSFLDCLYYSAISFSALGYGNWAPQPNGWIKGLGVAETFIGVFMMALFLTTFTRKMTR